jgi:hypothetical protein
MEALLARGLEPASFTLALKQSLRDIDSANVWSFGEGKEEKRITLSAMSDTEMTLFSDKKTFEKDYRV